MPGLFTSASHGLVCMWKPPGISTRLLDNVLVRLLGPHTRHARVGHLGTLDPAASGVVVLTLGRASLLAPYLDDRKCYDARVKFGISTRTDDATGAVDARADCRRLPDLRERVEAAVARGFVPGMLQQMPPTVSALRVRGVRGYKLRSLAGDAAAEAAALRAAAPRAVHLLSLRLHGWCDEVRAPLICERDGGWVLPPRRGAEEALPCTGEGSPHRVAFRVETLAPPADALLSTGPEPVACPAPELHLSIETGPGFYVRSLARDIGHMVGVPSTLATITRTSSSGLTQDRAHDLYATLRLASEKGDAAAAAALIMPTDAAFEHLPAVALTHTRLTVPHELMSPDARRSLVAGAVQLAVDARQRAERQLESAGAQSGALRLDPALALDTGQLLSSLHAWTEEGHVAFPAVELRPAGADGAASGTPLLGSCDGHLVRVYALARCAHTAEALLGAPIPLCASNVATAAPQPGGVCPVFLGLAVVLSKSDVCNTMAHPGRPRWGAGAPVDAETQGVQAPLRLCKVETVCVVTRSAPPRL